MAVNRDSNGYTFFFAIILVVVVGSSLAMIAGWTKPYQTRNGEVKKQLDILSAMLDIDSLGINRKNAEEEFVKYVDLKDAIVLDANGNIKEGEKAFDVDIRKEFKDKKLKTKDRNYPLFVATKEGKTF